MRIRQSADIVIIGGGITGAAIARYLSQFNLQVIVLEKEPDVAMGASKANSGILHAGFDPHTATLKASLNVRGNALYRLIKDDLGIPIVDSGSLVIAHSLAELEVLKDLQLRGKRNGVSGLEILSREQTLSREPLLAPDTLAALLAPSAALICPFTATIALMENAVRNGVEIIRECKATHIRCQQGKVTGVETDKGFFPAAYIINAAGVFADDISHFAGDTSFAITPHKGQYLLFDKTAGGIAHTVLFPTPGINGKGILVSPTVHGNLFIGPNSENGIDKLDTAITSKGLAEIIAGSAKLIPNLPLHKSITQFAGLRASTASHDFILRASEAAFGLVHAAGIDSPGLTSAPAIAEQVADILRDLGLKLHPKPSFLPINPPRITFHQPDDVYHAWIKQQPAYGRIICRCEAVSEGEIIAAIRQPCGARTMDGVKRRVRAGSGRCQGGFCGPKVAALLARELHIPITAVCKDTAQSYLVFNKSGLVIRQNKTDREVSRVEQSNL